jgi:hypothetical protein
MVGEARFAVDVEDTDAMEETDKIEYDERKRWR